MRYQCVKQYDLTDCAAACLSTICKQHHYNVGIAQIREYAGTDKQGTNINGILKAARKLGFEPKAVRGDRTAFFSNFTLPCIAHVLVDGKLLHYVVIHKITPNQIIIADPAVGLVKLHPDKFLTKHTKGAPPKYEWSGVLILLTKTNHFHEGNESAGFFRRYFKLLIPERKRLVFILIISVIYTLLGITGSFYFQILIDHILPQNHDAGLTILSVSVILIYIFKEILCGLRSHLMLKFGLNLDKKLMLGYYNHILNLPLSFFGTRRVGEIISRINDASKIRDAIGEIILIFMIDAGLVIIGSCIMFFNNPSLFIASLIIVIVYALIVTSFNKAYKRLNQAQMESNALMTSYMIEALNGIECIKTNTAEESIRTETHNKFSSLQENIFKLCRTTNIQITASTAIELIGGIVLLWMGGAAVLAGNMTAGALITFYSLFSFFLQPIKNIINIQPELQNAMVAARRLGEITDLPEENRSQPSPQKSIGKDITIQGLDFRYGTRKLVLKDINLKIKAGQKIAFIGESGSGKTTISKLLMRLYTPEKGTIYFGNQPIESIPLELLRERIAYISQDIFLFSGTILSNLTLGVPGATEDAVIEAAKLAQAHEFISKLPLGYNTYLDEGGSNLSGGQRQRLAIARAILKKSDIMILDEATSNLDSVTEKVLNQTIYQYAKDMTAIFIAHRLSTIKNCDVIFVFEDGQIIEHGSHQQLCELNGKYMEYVRNQTLAES